ncbi:hypothetical protein Bca52824_080005 [Brassica carinata]|uniref:H15 domain-containing protein n=1 Tax=Brassica carinata TaxID=52824 RepID=A0A8X7PZ19_BRACI|nr:hypothetical protein Bca52824_080005 [Brassica carinata]
MTTAEIEQESVPPMEPVSEKKKTKKAKEVKKTVAAAPRKKAVSTHPTYEEMIKDAIVMLKERTGSSQYAIHKFIEEKHKELSSSFRKLLLLNLKRLVASEKLVKVKASFKIPSAKPSSPKSLGGCNIQGSKGKTAVKAKERPAKAAKTSTVTSPGKKKAPAMATKKKTPVKKSVKPKTVKSPMKKRASRKAKK